MAGWHHRLDGHELSRLQELVMDREAWHRKESDTTELTDCQLQAWEGKAD